MALILPQIFNSPSLFQGSNFPLRHPNKFVTLGHCVSNIGYVMTIEQSQSLLHQVVVLHWVFYTLDYRDILVNI